MKNNVFNILENQNFCYFKTYRTWIMKWYVFNWKNDPNRSIHADCSFLAHVFRIIHIIKWWHFENSSSVRIMVLPQLLFFSSKLFWNGRQRKVDENSTMNWINKYCRSTDWWLKLYFDLCNKALITLCWNNFEVLPF